MPGTSQGTAYPDTGSTTYDDDLEAALAAAKAKTAELQELAADQRGQSFILPLAEGAYNTVCAWTGRRDWLNQARWAIHTPDGQRLRKHYQIALPTFLVLIVAIAAFADSRTGRDVAAAGDTIARHAGAGSAKAVQRCRAILRDLGLAVEMARGRVLTGDEHLAAELHHGGRQHRAASRWALTSPVWAVTGAAAERRHNPGKETTKRKRRGSGFVHLSRSKYLGSNKVTSRRTHQRAHTREAARPKSTTPRSPRPLHLQRAAAELLRHATTLDHGQHPGSVCNVLADIGIDTTRWRGRDIARALDHDTATRGWIWPHHSQMRKPNHLLRWRLAHIDFTGPSPADRAATARAARAERAADRAARRGPGSTERGRQAAIALFRQAQADRQNRHTQPQTASA